MHADSRCFDGVLDSVFAKITMIVYLYLFVQIETILV